jgi:hypothetical protein
MMVLLGDEAQVKARFSSFGDSATQDRCMVCVECTNRLGNHFGTHPMELLGDMGHVESRIVPFGDGVSVGVG